jgi:hypothetical protein
MPRARWLPVALAKIRELATLRKVRFTIKALRELANLEVGLDQDDACDVVAKLSAHDFSQRVLSRKTGEWMYIFRPAVGGTFVYVKLVIRSRCIVISFHEEEEGDEASEDAQ